jgi:hypothetical protein
MIQPIYFRCGEQVLEALLVYNFETVSDTMIVIPRSPGKVDEIVFFEKFPNMWSTDEMPAQQGEFYSAITAELENIFKAQHFSFRIYSRRSQAVC